MEESHVVKESFSTAIIVTVIIILIGVIITYVSYRNYGPTCLTGYIYDKGQCKCPYGTAEIGNSCQQCPSGTKYYDGGRCL